MVKFVPLYVPLGSAKHRVRSSNDPRGSSLGCLVVIGSGGVEKVLTFDLNDKEKEALNNTLTEVEKTVQETGL